MENSEDSYTSTSLESLEEVIDEINRELDSISVSRKYKYRSKIKPYDKSDFDECHTQIETESMPFKVDEISDLPSETSEHSRLSRHDDQLIFERQSQNDIECLTDPSKSQKYDRDMLNNYQINSEYKINKLSKCSADDCDFETLYDDSMENHLLTVHSLQKSMKCPVCEFVCCYDGVFYAHINMHFAGPPFYCDDENCTYSTDRLQTLLSHRFIHSEQKPYECTVCCSKFSIKKNLETHKHQFHQEYRAKPFRCDICSKAFASSNTLKQHRVTHIESRPYLCDLCGFSARYQSHLTSHKKVHTGNVVRCSLPGCSYSTPKRSVLAAHMRAHTQTRSHICDHCGRQFIEKSHLVRHTRMHRDDTWYQCDVCDYRTTRRDKFKEHGRRCHLPDTPRKYTRSTPISRCGGDQSITGDAVHTLHSVNNRIPSQSVAWLESPVFPATGMLTDHAGGKRINLSDSMQSFQTSGDGLSALRQTISTIHLQSSYPNLSSASNTSPTSLSTINSQSSHLIHSATNAITLPTPLFTTNSQLPNPNLYCTTTSVNVSSPLSGPAQNTGYVASLPTSPLNRHTVNLTYTLQPSLALDTMHLTSGAISRGSIDAATALQCGPQIIQPNSTFEYCNILPIAPKSFNSETKQSHPQIVGKGHKNDSLVAAEVSAVYNQTMSSVGIESVQDYTRPHPVGNRLQYYLNSSSVHNA